MAAVLGLIGVFLPVLPTTPFLLLAAFCFTRSSQRLTRMLTGNRLLGSYLRDYLEGKGMPLKNKLVTLLLLWAVLGCTIAFVIDNLIIRLVLLAVLIGVTVHIVSLKKPAAKWQSVDTNKHRLA